MKDFGPHPVGNRKHLKVLEQGNQVYLETRLPRGTDFNVLQHVGVVSERKRESSLESGKSPFLLHFRTLRIFNLQSWVTLAVCFLSFCFWIMEQC